MSLIHEADRVSEALIRSQQHRGTEVRHVPSDTDHPSQTRFNIALSRQTGSQGTAIARTVSSRLGWTVYDHELLEVMARDLQVRVKLLEDLDERHVSWLQETVEAFCNVGAIREATFVRHLVETMLALAARGRCIMVGRGSPFVLPAESTLRVRLMAPLEERISNVCQEQHLTRYEAARIIAKQDAEREEFIRQHFAHDPADARHFDLVLNTARFPAEECAELIVEALHTKRQVAPPAIAV